MTRRRWQLVAYMGIVGLAMVLLAFAVPGSIRTIRQYHTNTREIRVLKTKFENPTMADVRRLAGVCSKDPVCARVVVQTVRRNTPAQRPIIRVQRFTRVVRPVTIRRVTQVTQVVNRPVPGPRGGRGPRGVSGRPGRGPQGPPGPAGPPGLPAPLPSPQQLLAMLCTVAHIPSVCH